MEGMEVKQTYRHSPGPWKFIPEALGGKDDTNMGCIRDANMNVVCDFGDCEQYYPTEGNPPNPYDAKLMEAAPELFDHAVMLISALATISTAMRLGLPLDKNEIATFAETHADATLKLLERIGKDRPEDGDIRGIVAATSGYNG